MGDGSSRNAGGDAKLDCAPTVSELSAVGDRRLDRLLVDDPVGTAVWTTWKLDLIVRSGGSSWVSSRVERNFNGLTCLRDEFVRPRDMAAGWAGMRPRDLADEISGAFIGGSVAGFRLANLSVVGDRCGSPQCRPDRRRRNQNGGAAVGDLVGQRRVSCAKESQPRGYPAGCGRPSLIRRLTSLPEGIRCGQLCWLPIEENGGFIGPVGYYK